MIKKYEFETYETNNAADLDRHLEAAYNDGWVLRDNIRMINTGIVKEAQYEKSMQFMYSVTMFKIVEEEELLWGPDIADEIVDPTTGTEDEYYCTVCGSHTIETWDRYIYDKHYVERVCGDCHSDAIAIYKKY